jgi:hypothetical protein
VPDGAGELDVPDGAGELAEGRVLDAQGEPSRVAAFPGSMPQLVPSGRDNYPRPLARTNYL